MKENLLKRVFIICSFALSSMAFAQERTLTGRVTSADDGSSLPGVNVVVKGTTNGTVTDADGKYSMSVPASGGVIVFSFIGLKSQEVEIGGQTTIDVSLGLDVQQLNEVIVVGQGAQKEKKALGYAISSVGADQLAARPQQDVARILQGKVPGVNISPTGGTSGSGSSINIRGYSSLSGSTQPLFVVDGVPFNSSTNNGSGFSTGGAAVTPSRFLDLDPNNIETINVLKGLAATVLYGDQGRNGVILVTTKSGKGKKNAEVTVQQTTTITEVASLPKFQSSWGNGFQGLYGAFFSNWGPDFSEVDSVGHPYQFLASPSLRDAYPQYLFNRIKYDPAQTIDKFFRKGVASNTYVNFTGGTDRVGYNASASYTKEQGFVPGNDVNRLNISLGLNASITKKLTLVNNILFSVTGVETPPLNGATGGGATFNGVPSLYGQFLYTPRNLDIFDWPSATPDNRSIYFRGGNDIANPLWLAQNYRELNNTTRVFNSTTLTYDITDHLSLTYRVGYDTYTEAQERRFNRGGVQGPNILNGVYQTQNIRNTIFNQDVIFGYNKQLNQDFNMSARVGFNARNDRFVRDGLYSEGQAIDNLFKHYNFSTASSRSIGFDGRILNRETEEQRMGVYGDFSFDFKQFLFLNLAGRNDWTSTLETGNNNIFYPSASVSFIPTDAFANLKSSTLNYLKFRVGYGTSAGFAPFPYGTRSVALLNTRGYVDLTGAPTTVNSIGNFLGNRNLKPELQQEIEVGMEARILNERIGIDLTFYDRSTSNLITEAPLDPATGYTSTLTNVGKLSNKGIELGLNGKVMNAGAFRWDATLNFNIVRPEIIDLGGGLSEVLIAGFTTRGNFAIPGRPYNIIKGNAVRKSPDGQRIVRANDGLYAVDPIIREIGNPNPDWTASLFNTFTFKGISLNVQFDYRQGGAMYASTPSATIGRGVVATDVQYGYDQTFILPGVIEFTNPDGSLGYRKNDLQVTAADYGFNVQFNGTDDTSIFDGTSIRLREISLAYDIPKSLMAKTPFKTASIQLNGNNLWFNAINVPKNVNFDPEVLSTGVGNGAGFDYLTGPSARRYGFVVRLTF
ncbi:MAG: SusC/RagA family TonB-linked outer membrane protein [Bacteroidetes bacterium]|nr:SusC/RagA family TonB-linked outer membrane protein [Bacteroidota bacterium]